MSLDTTGIGVAAARLMDRVADEYGDDAEIESIGVIVELSYGDPDGDRSAVEWTFRDAEGDALSGPSAVGMANIVHHCLLTGRDDHDHE